METTVISSLLAIKMNLNHVTLLKKRHYDDKKILVKSSQGLIYLVLVLR